LSVSVKKTKTAQIIITSNDSSPSGLIWDGDSYSCAYDALFTWGSGPLLHMACTSPISFNWFLCTITEKIGVSTVVDISMDILVFLLLCTWRLSTTRCARMAMDPHGPTGHMAAYGQNCT
jgi:hypothetical protein